MLRKENLCMGGDALSILQYDSIGCNNYDGNGRLYVECDGRKVIIEDTEVVRFPYTTDIRPFLGQEISFVIKTYSALPCVFLQKLIKVMA